MKRIALLTGLLLLVFAFVFGLTTQPVPAAQTPILDYDFVVVRAYYDDLEMVAQISRVAEPWEINLEKQYIVLDVDAAEYQQLEQAGFRLEIDDEQTAKLNAPRVPLPNQGGGIPGFPCYRTVEETFASAAAIAATYPNLAEWLDVGDSWEKLTAGGLPGYDMMVLRLTNESINRPKPKLFITSAIHAREYTTAELNTRFAEYLINNYGSDADATWLLDNHEIHLMLQTNPDGRKQAETGLLWRKNTNNNYCTNTNDRGADLNRNFQFQWGCCGGSSNNQCSNTYRGASAASEPETQAVQNYIFANFPDLREPPIGAAAPLTTTGIYIDIHSYSQLVLWPWGFTSTHTGNNTQLVTLGRKFAYFNGYTPQQAIDLYITDGTTDDFVYGEMGLPAYTFELGTEFFQACAAFESTIYPDNLPALVYAAKAVREPYLAPAGPETLNVVPAPTAVVAGTSVTLTATLNDTRFNNSNGSEPTQIIAAAEYYVDVPPWITDTTPVALPMSPADGSFNSSVEGATAVIDTTGLTDGRHTIFVRGQDASGTWGVFSAAFLYIEVASPEASFTSSTPDALGTPTTFTNHSTGSDLTFAWDFGDGNSSTAANPSHTYGTVASYTVTLTATNNLGSDVYTAVVEILQSPQASFAATSPVLLGETAVFSNTSTGSDLSFTWNFGDGLSSTQASPTHTYALTGTYTVTLTAVNAVGESTAVVTVEVVTIIKPPEFDHFLYLPFVIALPEE